MHRESGTTKDIYNFLQILGYCATNNPYSRIFTTELMVSLLIIISGISKCLKIGYELSRVQTEENLYKS